MGRFEKSSSFFQIFIEFFGLIWYNNEVYFICPWHSWIARETPTLEAAGSNPVGQAKKTPSCNQDGVFQLYSPLASSMHKCVICPSDVIWCLQSKHVESYKANIISL